MILTSDLYIGKLLLAALCKIILYFGLECSVANLVTKINLIFRRYIVKSKTFQDVKIAHVRSPLSNSSLISQIMKNNV